MNKFVRNIIILVAALAALGGGIWWVMGYEPKPEDSETTDQSSYETVYKVTEDEVCAISVNNGGSVLSFKKSGDEWSLDGYSNSQISQTKVKSLVSSVSSISSRNLVTDSKADCGLDNPNLTVSVTLTGGTTDVISIGNVSPVLGEYFCCVNGGDIYTISSYKVDDYKKGAEHYTDFSRTSFKAADIVELKIERKGKNTLHIREKSDGGEAYNTWEIIAPYKNVYSAIDQFIQEKILTAVEGVSITTPAASADTGMSSPKAVVTIVSAPADESGQRGEAVTTVLKIGRTSGDVAYVEYQNEAYEVPASSISFVDTDEFLVVSKLLALVPIQGLTEMKVTTPGESYSFEVTHTNINADDDEMTFKINGAAAQEKKAKSVYQEVIGLSADGAYKGEKIGDTMCEIVFVTTSGNKTITLSSINEMSAAFTVDGATEFTVKKSSVEKMLSAIAELAANPV